MSSVFKTADELARHYGVGFLDTLGGFERAFTCSDGQVVYLTDEHYELASGFAYRQQKAKHDEPPKDSIVDVLQQALDESATLTDPKPAPEGARANPKQAFGDKKVPLHLVPFPALVYEALAFKSGELKYGLDNYRSTDNKVEAMTYVAGAKRHIEQWVAGEEVDPKELVHHLGAARASLGIVIAALEHGTLIDNRPPKPLDLQRLMADAETVVAHLNNLYGPKENT